MSVFRHAVITITISSALLAGCGGTTSFHSAQAFAVSGTPPVVAKPEPPPSQPRVEVHEDAIEITEKIQFAVNRAVILPESDSLLEEIGTAIKKHPEIRRIAIGGHASAEGSAHRNAVLSDARARAVMKHLVEREGVSASILEAKGFGATRPIADNTTQEGRAANRRVEFVVLERDKGGQ